MKTTIFLLLVLLVTTSCKPKEEAYIPVDEYLVWQQDMTPEIYDENGIAPTHQMLNCRRNISGDSQRYFRLKFNKNLVEHSVSPEGVVTTVHRFAQLKHHIKVIHNQRQISYTDWVIAAVDITMQALPAGTKLTVVLSPDRPNLRALYAPENTDVAQAKAGDELLKININDPRDLRVSLQGRYQAMGMAEAPDMECEYVDLESEP